jgi:hypothetical protein
VKPADRASSLPAQPVQLIGRTRELLALRDLLLCEDVRLVTIGGVAGIGKTSLAIVTAAKWTEATRFGWPKILGALRRDPGVREREQDELRWWSDRPLPGAVSQRGTRPGARPPTARGCRG